MYTVIISNRAGKVVNTLEEAYSLTDAAIAKMGRFFKLGMVKIFDKEGNRVR